MAAQPFANRGPAPRSPQGDKSRSREVPHMRSLLLLASAAALIALPAAAMQHDGHAVAKSGDAIAAAVAASTRTATNTARDKYRHPAETLAFFGVKPGDTVVELWPGGGGYTERPAPLPQPGGGPRYPLDPLTPALPPAKNGRT